MEFAAMIAGQRGQKNKDIGSAESRSDVVADKSKDRGEVASVIMGAELALARLSEMSRKGMNVNSQIAEFEKVRSRAGIIMSELSGTGPVDLTAIAAAIGSIESELRTDIATDEAPKDDKPEMAQQTDAALLSQKEAERAVFANPPPILRDLIQRDDTLDGFMAANTQLSQRTADVDNGKADLLTAVAIAGLLYEGYAHKEKNQDMSVAAQDKAAEYAQSLLASGVSQESAAARLTAILKYANAMHEGMQVSQEQGAGQVMAAMEALVLKPLDAHMKDADIQRDNAGTHIATHAKKSDQTQFNRQTEMWQLLRDGTVRELKEKLERANTGKAALALPAENGGQLYESIMKELGISGILDAGARYSKASKDILKTDGAIYSGMHRDVKAAESAVMDVFTGRSDNYIAAAKKAGIVSEGFKGMLDQTAGVRNALELDLKASHKSLLGALEKASGFVLAHA